MPRDHSLASLRLIPARSVSSVPPQRHLSSHPNNNTNNNVIILIPVGTPSTGKVQSQLQSDLPGNDRRRRDGCLLTWMDRQTPQGCAGGRKQKL